MSDWIDDFMAWTSGLPSPKIYRKWAAITAIAGALERRCFVMSAGRAVYPNLYVLLVGTPGVGKNIIQEVHNVWYEAKKFKVSPDSISRAALVDALAEAGTTIIRGTSLTEYHTMLVAVPEFGNFVPAHDLDFLSALNRIYDNPTRYVERRRWVNAGAETVIVHPQLTIIGGTQPGFLHSLMPEEAWTMGTTSRLIMVYDPSPVDVALHLEVQGKPNGYVVQDATSGTDLINRLARLRDAFGPFAWTAKAAEAAEGWYGIRNQNAPTHTKLIHYVPRRYPHVLKLCAVSAASRENMVIDLDDFTRALDWLFEAEGRMPDIFQEMAGKSDAVTIEQLHRFAWAAYAKGKTPLDESVLYQFLKNKTQSYNAPRIMEHCERAGYLVRIAGTRTYKPMPLADGGVL